MESEEETQVGVVFAKIVVLSFLSRERQTNTLSTLPLQMFVYFVFLHIESLWIKALSAYFNVYLRKRSSILGDIKNPVEQFFRKQDRTRQDKKFCRTVMCPCRDCQSPDQRRLIGKR